MHCLWTSCWSVTVVFLTCVCGLLSCLVPMLSVFIIIWAVNRGGRLVVCNYTAF